MENVREHAQKFNMARKKRRRWLNVVMVLASVTLFWTVYSLIMPAVTESAAMYCGYAEHPEHTDECYEEVRSLTCKLEEGAVHIHTDACYEEQTKLTCEEEHEHEDSCYTTERVLICEQNDTEPHVHDDSCYETKKIRACGLKTHTHSLQCFSNPNADLESEAMWSMSFNRVELTTNWAEDVVEIAKTQLGYAESADNYSVREDGFTKDGYTRYGEWYGYPYSEWNAMFCSFCLNYAGIPETAFPYEASVPMWTEILSGWGWNLYRTALEYTPVSGDLIFFDINYDGIADHVGIIAEVKTDAEDGTTTLKTIEGDKGDCVGYHVYDLTDYTIAGYAALPENPEENTARDTENVTERIENTETFENVEDVEYYDDFEEPEEDIRDIPHYDDIEDTEESFSEAENLEEENSDEEEPEAGEENLDEEDEVEEENLDEAEPEAGEENLDEEEPETGEENLDEEDEAEEENLDEEDKEKSEDEESSENEITTIQYVTEDGATITLTGNLPEGAKIRLAEVSSKVLEEILTQVGSGTPVFAYDITIVDADGFEWQPDELGARVLITGLPMPQGEIEVAHVQNAGKIEVVESSTTGDGIEFEAPGFSIYVAYTVDFSYEDLSFSIPGESSILLSDVFAQLGIRREVSEAVMVVFSNPRLIRVERISDDWLLTSLAAFDTDEWLTVYFEDGKYITINTTDAQTTYWKKASSVKNGGTYLIVYENNGTKYALTSPNTTGTSVTLTAEGDVFQTSSVTSAMEWTYTANNSFQNVKTTKNYLSLTKSSLISSTEKKFDLTYSSGSWKIKRNDASYYLACNNSGTFSRSSTASNITIYEMAEAPVTTYWKPVTAIEDTSANYILYNVTSGWALGVNDAGETLCLNPQMTAVEDHPDVFTTRIGSEYWWNFSSEGTSSRQTNAAHSSYGIQLSTNGSAISTSTTKNTLETKGDYWWIHNNSNYLRYYKNSSTIQSRTDTNDTDRRNFIIYMQVEEPVDDPEDDPDDDPGGGQLGPIIVPDLVEKAPDHSKYIDAFREGGDNPETDLDNEAREGGDIDGDIFDLYRLYLDLGPESAHEALDILFVVDTSTSMSGYTGYDAKDILGFDCWRCWALDTLLNGESLSTTQSQVPGKSQTTNSKQHQTILYDNGLIRRVAAMNPENKIAVARFSDTASVLLDWTPASRAHAITYENIHGTNYAAGLIAAKNLLTDDEVVNDGRKKVMIFLSDGLPTYHYDSLEVSPSSKASGDGSETKNEEQKAASIISDFVSTNYFGNDIIDGRLEVYAIGIGDWRMDLLNQLSSNGQATASTDFGLILENLDMKVTGGVGHYIDLKITDTLSDYVDFYTDDVDFLIEKVTTDAQGNTSSVVLYENNAITTLGAECLDYVDVDFETKTVTVDFKETFEEEGDTIYRTSFNVKTTQLAYDEYEANLQDSSKPDGYGGVIGDNGTDYPGNETSSRQGGFHANDAAILEYTQVVADKRARTDSVQFDHPVVQVRDTPDTPDTPDSPPSDGSPKSTSFEHSKTIDFLGDGTSNPDTSLAGEDSYRLYLDMTGKLEPVDLLIVVDTSGSMSKTDMTIGSATKQRRDAAVTNFLNGTTSSSGSLENGFLSFFLNLNEENRVSVVQFNGTDTDAYTNNYMSSGVRSYTKDTSVLLDWTDTNTFVNCVSVEDSGTNYEAGLKMAAEQFSRVYGHKKMMIFLSDGVPTFFMIDSNDIGTVTYNRHTIDRYDVGKRWGTGRYATEANYTRCTEPTKRAFDDFVKLYPDTVVYTVGVSEDINATSASGSQSPDVLKYMAQNGGGQYFGVENSMSNMMITLKSIFYPKGVVITDNLSKYVRFADDPEIKVTMTNKDTNETTVLYSDGALTSGADRFLTSVNITPGDTNDAPTASTGTITAVFNSEYQFEPTYVYTVSFNVEATRTAYDEYAASGYNREGDAGTDYRTNRTSSEEPGFYSNDSAVVRYNVSGTINEDSYDRPVIQVRYYNLKISKQVSGIRTTTTFPFELTVTDSNDAAVDLSGATLPKGVTLKTGTVNVLEFSLGHDGAVEFENLFRKGTKLKLVETDHDGYSVAMSVGQGTHSGDEQDFTMKGNTNISVTNTPAVVLPETGGIGTLIYIFSGAAFMLIAAMCGIGLRRKREGGTVS